MAPWSMDYRALDRVKIDLLVLYLISGYPIKPFQMWSGVDTHRLRILRTVPPPTTTTRFSGVGREERGERERQK